MENAIIDKTFCTNFFPVWARARLSGWPSAQPGSAVLVSLPARSFFVPCFYLSAFQLLLIQTSTSIAEVKFDLIAVEIVFSN